MFCVPTNRIDMYCFYDTGTAKRLASNKYYDCFFSKGSKLGLISADDLHLASMTGGLVGHSHHTVLPSIPPVVTFIATLLAMMVRTATRSYLSTFS